MIFLAYIEGPHTFFWYACDRLAKPRPAVHETFISLGGGGKPTDDALRVLG